MVPFHWFQWVWGVTAEMRSCVCRDLDGLHTCIRAKAKGLWTSDLNASLWYGIISQLHTQTYVHGSPGLFCVSSSEGDSQFSQSERKNAAVYLTLLQPSAPQNVTCWSTHAALYLRSFCLETTRKQIIIRWNKSHFRAKIQRSSSLFKWFFLKTTGIIHTGLHKVTLQKTHTDEICEEVLKTNNSFAC